MVGQIKAKPEVNIAFQTLATTAIQRSANGILCILVNDDTKKTHWTEIGNIADLTAGEWDSHTVEIIKSAYLVYSPKKILIRAIQDDERSDYSPLLKELENKNIDVLACPSADSGKDATVVAWIKSVFGTDSIGKTIQYVSSHSNGADHVAIIELANTGNYKTTVGTFTAQEFTVAIGAMIAGCPINVSLDNKVVIGLNEVAEIEAAKGKFSIYNDDGKYRVNYAVNSKTTFNSMWKKDTRKIKVISGMLQIVKDIRDTFRNYWIGNYLNSYDNKMNFCSNVTKVYFKELQPNILSADYKNHITIDFEAQKRYVVTEGLDPDEMTELEILKYPTGDDVYLTGDVRFTDTMSNLFLNIKM